MRFILVILFILFVFGGNFYFKSSQVSNEVQSEKIVKSEEVSIPEPEKQIEKITVKPIENKSNEPIEPKQEVKKVQEKRTPIDDSFLSDKVQQNRSIINQKVGENYIDSILSAGRLIRWNPATFPLTVYIENNPNLPPYYYQQIRKAFDRWQSATGNYITFKYTDIKDKAQIKCYFPANIERKCGVSNVAAWHRFNLAKNRIKFSEIRFAKVSCQRTLYSPQTIYTTALHEIGHALGISGHSVNKQDLMYPVASKEVDISDNDIRTLRLIYSILPDVTNAPFTEQQKVGLITPDDVWGSKEGRVELQLKDLQDRVKNVPQSSYSTYVQMGSLYYEKEDYNNAISSFNKALEIATDDKNLADINGRISLAYMKLKDYYKALSYAQTANKLSPSNNMLVHIANLHYEMENYAEAKTMMRDLLNENPKVYNAYQVLCNIYLKEKDTESLMLLYERGKHYFPDNPPIILRKNNN